MGVAIVHQHFMLVPQFSVRDNLLLDQMGGLGGMTDPALVEERAKKAAESVGWQIDFNAKTGSLPVGVQQRIEIVKALAFDPQVIILDEPTAVLTPDEVEDLIRVLKQLKEQGKTVILIAHKLNEVYAAADRVTVLRQGRTVGTGLLSELTPDALATWMVGEVPLPLSLLEVTQGEVLMTFDKVRVKGSRGEEAVRGVSFQLHAGEILGIGGVDGNGQVELAEAAAGVRPVSSGVLDAKESPAYIPQDRQTDGLALTMSVFDNLLISGINSAELMRSGWLKMKEARRWGERLAADYQIKTPDLDVKAKNLSGGNQQKIVVSRVLSRNPRIIVAVNPTRGLDISAARFVHENLLKAARDGAALLLISTDREELSALSSRIMIMSRGELTQADRQDLKADVLAGVVT
jgi:simple sugar transport system ATP-binding protein